MINIVVSNTVQTPIYQQIYDQISSQIMNGDLKADHVLLERLLHDMVRGGE